MTEYDALRIFHVLAAVAATGPLLVAPWLSAQLKRCDELTKPLLLRGLTFTDRFYNVAGWGLILSGVLMFWLLDWRRSFEVWFMLSVSLFVLDSVLEKCLRDPAREVLERTQAQTEQWQPAVRRIYLGVLGQALCTCAILLVMLLHSQMTLNMLALRLF
ncbi:DUF2269 family protein [Pseudomonas sp. MUP55]|uniref:DUF2269 family protein n=1 Tax=Pseudomonas sp. MUP55 TaxID=3087234 RepID=UPI002A598759|nr:MULTISPECIES: hypothetical protein [unclassified Pseudomonas]WPN92027.1 hypothetical protein SC319_22830 [Pseudomonas sp. MUP56]WPN97554.1 hypothetical protein SC318_22835 [Pseudomonas sp. MUP55]